MDTFNAKVKGRADIAEVLRTTELPLALRVGLLDEDLEEIVTQGRIAEQADSEQKAEEAEQSADISLRAEAIADVLEQESGLRARVPAVVRDLEAGDQSRLALVLRRVSYERFRVLELQPPPDAPPPTEEEQEELRRLVRIPREDHATRLDGLARWIDAMRAPGREPIVAALARRGLSAEALATLGAQARTLAAQGRNVRRALDATAREAAAVQAQRTRWNAVRRLVRRAARQDPTLAALFAAC